MTETLNTSAGSRPNSWTGAAAILFDLDGVLTPTAVVHERAWQELFDCYLETVPEKDGYQESDYFDHIDGKPRFDGVRDFLTSRGITLPEGPADDDPDNITVQGLGNRKNRIFNDIVSSGVEPYAGSVRFLEAVLDRGLKVAVVSSSRNAPSVLRAAGLADRFEVVVDGVVAAEEGLPGKPDRQPMSTLPGSWTCPASNASSSRTPCPAFRRAVPAVSIPSSAWTAGQAGRLCSTPAPPLLSATSGNSSNPGTATASGSRQARQNFQHHLRPV